MHSIKYYISHDLLAEKSVTGYDIALKAYLDAYGYWFSGYYLDLKTCAINIHTLDIKAVKASLNWLIKNNYVNITEVEKDIYLINTPNKVNPPFTIIDTDIIFKIINTDYTFRYSMLKHYCTILTNRFYNNAYKAAYVCDRGLNFFADQEGVSERVLSKYNTILENMGLLYIYQSVNTHKTNLYSLPEDKKYAISYAEYTNRTSLSDNANKKRSLMQKYYRLQQGHKYSKSEINEIKAYIEEYNIMASAENKKDMSIFDTCKY